MKITNKLESYEKINELGLNRFPEQIFKIGETKKVRKFINAHPAEYYAIRDKSKAGGIFKLKVKAEDVEKEITGYDIFSINVSSYNYLENQILVGEILLSENTISGILSTNKTYSVRDAIKDPTFNFKTNIFDNDTLNKIPNFDNLYKYIVTNKLQNVIIEFAYFNKPVGINNENIIVYELRTDY